MSEIRTEVPIDTQLYERMKQYAHSAGLTVDEVFAQSAEALLQYIDQLPPGARDAFRMRVLCEGSGYTNYTTYPSGRDACIASFAFTVAILADMTPDGYGERWCYATIEQARAALAAWDGAEHSEPRGWHRHPNTGRRRPDGDAAREYIAR